MTFDGTTATVYVDGVVEATTDDWSANTFSGFDQTVIGALLTSILTDTLDGESVAGAAVWDYVLHSSDVARLNSEFGI